MAHFIIRRVLISIPVVFGIVTVVFILARAIPGDPCTTALGERATDEICDAYNERFGLNEPIANQFERHRTLSSEIGFRQGEAIV